MNRVTYITDDKRVLTLGEVPTGTVFKTRYDDEIFMTCKMLGLDTNYHVSLKTGIIRETNKECTNFTILEKVEILSEKSA